MKSKTVGVVALVLGALFALPPSPARAEIAGTGTFDIDVGGSLPDVTFDGNINFTNASHTVGGMGVNLGTSLGMMTYTGTAHVTVATLSATFTVNGTDAPFGFTGGGGGACQTACVGGTATFAGALDTVTDPNTVLPDNFTYTFDGSIFINFLGNGPGGTVAINAFAPDTTNTGMDVMAESGPTTFFDTRAQADKTFDALVVFDQVTVGGATTFIALTAVPGTLPAGISLDPLVSRYVDIVTTATNTGTVQVCFNFPDVDVNGIVDGTTIEIAQLRILHKATGADAFVEVPTVATMGQVCGVVSDLSPFVVGLVPATTTTTIVVTTTTTSTSTTTTLPLGTCTDGVSCLNNALAASLCGSEAIHPKLRATLKMKLKKAKALLTKAGNADATKAAKFVAKVRGFIELLRTKADAFAARTKKPISSDCRDGIRAALDQIDQAITDNPPGS